MQNDLISRSERLRKIRQTELDDYGSAMLISDVKTVMRTFIEEAPAVDAVSRPVFEQIQWERDCAMQQLKDHGIPFGGIAPTVDAVRCEECMFRSQYANEEGLYKCGAITCKEGHCAMVEPHFSCIAGKKRGKDDGTSQA